ncbi:MAG TPA: hypothetical protein P5525_12705, partial [Candidatus Paceibacterota bacterium]|nr:hypothetical protein [Candidatus Paceibacterota bacterium]
LAIALLAPSPQPTGRPIRLAAAVLGAADENCAGIVRYIALSGSRFSRSHIRNRAGMTISEDGADDSVGVEDNRCHAVGAVSFLLRWR